MYFISAEYVFLTSFKARVNVASEHESREITVLPDTGSPKTKSIASLKRRSSRVLSGIVS